MVSGYPTGKLCQRSLQTIDGGICCHQSEPYPDAVGVGLIQVGAGEFFQARFLRPDKNGTGAGLIPARPISVNSGYAQLVGVITISTRRFCARPAALAFDVIGS